MSTHIYAKKLSNNVYLKKCEVFLKIIKLVLDKKQFLGYNALVKVKESQSQKTKGGFSCENK